MIQTYSVIKGYKTMMGTLPIHLGIMLASMIYVWPDIPKGFGVLLDKDLEMIFYSMMFVHVVCSIAWLMQI